MCFCANVVSLRYHLWWAFISVCMCGGKICPWCNFHFFFIYSVRQAGRDAQLDTIEMCWCKSDLPFPLSRNMYSILPQHVIHFYGPFEGQGRSISFANSLVFWPLLMSCGGSANILWPMEGKQWQLLQILRTTGMYAPIAWPHFSTVPTHLQ